MTDFTIRQGGFCPVCRGIVLRDCSHTMRELRDKFASDAGRDYDSLAAENAALRAELAFARSTGDESALEYHALKARLAEARRVCDEQANDEGLWFMAVTVTEDYLQAALRRLHAAVEGTASQPHDNKGPVSVQANLASTLTPHPMLSPTLRCRACGAFWRQCDDFSMTLRSSTCCDDCNNAPVGSQLVPLGIASQPRPLTSDERAALDRAFERSITVIHPGIDATGDQPTPATDPERVEIARCPRCGGLPRPTLLGRTICDRCGGLDVPQPPSPAALRQIEALTASQPSDDSALTPGEEWWMDVAGVPVRLDEWEPGAKKRKADRVPATDSADVPCTCGETLFHKANCEAVQAQNARDRAAVTVTAVEGKS